MIHTELATHMLLITFTRIDHGIKFLLGRGSWPRTHLKSTRRLNQSSPAAEERIHCAGACLGCSWTETNLKCEAYQF